MQMYDWDCEKKSTAKRAAYAYHNINIRDKHMAPYDLSFIYQRHAWVYKWLICLQPRLVSLFQGTAWDIICIWS